MRITTGVLRMGTGADMGTSTRKNIYIHTQVPGTNSISQPRNSFYTRLIFNLPRIQAPHTLQNTNSNMYICARNWEKYEYALNEHNTSVYFYIKILLNTAGTLPREGTRNILQNTAGPPARKGSRSISWNTTGPPHREGDRIIDNITKYKLHTIFTYRKYAHFK
jgi:hypothetical protein